MKLSKKKRKEQGELRRAKKRKGELLRDLMAVTGDESAQVDNLDSSNPDYPL